MWLEDLYDFATSKLNPTSTAMLIDLMKFEADFKSI